MSGKTSDVAAPAVSRSDCPVENCSGTRVIREPATAPPSVREAACTGECGFFEGCTGQRRDGTPQTVAGQYSVAAVADAVACPAEDCPADAPVPVEFSIAADEVPHETPEWASRVTTHVCRCETEFLIARNPAGRTELVSPSEDDA